MTTSKKPEISQATLKKQKTFVIASLITSVLLPLVTWLLISALSPATDMAVDISILLYALVWCGAFLVSNFIFVIGAIIAIVVIILVRARNISLEFAVVLLVLSVVATAGLIRFMMNYSESLFALI